VPPGRRPTLADPYEDFARIYDAWQSLYPRPFGLAIAPYIEAAVRKHGVPARTLADLACGTGTFAVAWAKRHPDWSVIGQDLSAAMIAVAQEAARKRPATKTNVSKKAEMKGRRPQFLVQDLRELALPEPVGLLTCLFDSVNHIRSASGLAAVFRRMHSVALPKALLVFDLIDPAQFGETFSGYSISEGPDLYVGMQMDHYEGRDGVLTGEARFTFFSRQGAHWSKHESRVVERAWSQVEITELLEAARFEIVQVRAIDPSEDPDVFVPRLLWIARAKP